MTEQISIMSAEGYMQKYGVKGIGGGADRWMVRRQMLDSMRKEIFDQAVFRIGPQVFSSEYQPTEKEQQKLINILDNAEKKWRRICRIFEMYKETIDLIQPKDLREYLDEDLSAAVQSKEVETVMAEPMTSGYAHIEEENHDEPKEQEA